MPDPTTTPVRLQRSRRKGARLVSPNGLPVVVVTRPGPWGNPYQAFLLINVPPGVRAKVAVQHFRRYAVDRVAREPDWLAPLRGKNLACWCKPGKPCHGDVLLELANA